ncbi:hypothetical protein CSB37_03450 [bacterium DOLZORAL124_38_8]|nr:MAG: hypothetical protein CSB37_03450 [bacterium DOLZORAL124_38_8]
MKKTTELLEKEYVEALSTYRTQYSLMVQLFTVLVIGDFTVVGFGVDQRLSGVIALAAIFPIGIAVMMYFVNYYMFPIIFVAISIEQKLGNNRISHLMSTYFSFISHYSVYREMGSIANIKDEEVRFSKLKKLKVTSYRKKRSVNFLYLLLGVFHIIGGILLNIFFGWNFW